MCLNDWVNALTADKNRKSGYDQAFFILGLRDYYTTQLNITANLHKILNVTKLVLFTRYKQSMLSQAINKCDQYVPTQSSQKDIKQHESTQNNT